ncbi:LacI family DNA-binding transcriptional regulator [Paenarthrobacter sp. AT5]|uniref:LacI family DNA-binding transcriptional regulator n=1 Tax=Paenarthrobacter TaxID=1742992 RepID=UPI001F623BB8|nr:MULTISPECIES: LacI family DNA-binding transcriptional regulator [Paenarthrobacter]WOC62805.1 LacI family DNA-binding transcriptional regulator [Paenarthrobacter sp. AT5]
MMASASDRRPTIKDVAERAGVSKSLVSLVLRDSPRVSDERRQRVLKVVEEMGYELNLAARSLATRHSGNIGVLVSDLHNPWAFDVADAARPVLEDAGHTVLFSAVTAKDRGVDQSILQAFRDLRVSGLLVIGTVPDKAPFNRAVSGGAVVFAGGGPDYIDTADVVRSDDTHGMVMVVEHLIAQGHENIVHLGGLGGSVGRARVDGYSAAMEEHGLSRHISVVDADFYQESGYVAAQKALNSSRSQHLRPTALACLNDLAALGAMTAADECGAKVAITGYDNIALGAMPRLGLTTVDPDSTAIGVTGAKALLERIHGEGNGFVHHPIAPRLVVRTSSLTGL